MTKLAISICILLAGIINFLPLLAVLSVERIKSSYGVDFSDPTLELFAAPPGSAFRDYWRADDLWRFPG